MAWSCVLDDTEALWKHFLVWIATLLDCAGVSPDDIVIHHVTDLRPDIHTLVTRLGLRTQPIPRFDPRSPHSNKISQCATDFGSAERVVLTDVDLAFLARPPIESILSPVAGKLVDFPNPPIEVLRDLFRHAGLPLPETPLTATFVDPQGAPNPFQTFPANYNGGFYVIDRSVLSELGLAWARRARWLLDAELIPERYAIHVDQISFCMAAHECGLNTQSLENAWNLPTHVENIPGDAPPYVVHHHGRLDDALGILPLRPTRHEDVIARANVAIAAFLHRYGMGLSA
ncbi:MAG: hypothetical protein H7124_03880 [Phycisphaerales bacterium]|nr:hypothetical protein [Hyphomonadaceae bacterium]